MENHLEFQLVLRYYTVNGKKFAIDGQRNAGAFNCPFRRC